MALETWKRLLDRPWLRFPRTVVREVIADDLAGEAARAAYFFFLSLFPIVIALFALTGLFGGDAAFDAIMGQIRQVLPGDAAEYLQRFVGEVTGSNRPGMLSLGILLTLWSGSNIFTALIVGLNRVYDLRETRSWWRRRLLAFFAMGISLLAINLGTVALLAGPALVRRLGGGVFWQVVRWPLALVLFAGLLWALYYLLPSRRRQGAVVPTLIGAVSGSVLWVLGTLVFRMYLREYSRFDATYGFVGGVIVLLLWLYLTAFSILVGGEIAATSEQLRREDWEVGAAPSG